MSFVLIFQHSNAWHADDGSGEVNKTSIGIEMTQSANSSLTIRDASTENSARLAAILLKRFHFGVS